MPRTKGALNKELTADKKINVRLTLKLLNELDIVAGKHGQVRSEALIEAIRDYVKKG